MVLLSLIQVLIQKHFSNTALGLLLVELQKKIVLKFAPQEGRYVKAQPLHPTQKIVEENKDGLSVELHVIPSYELKAAIRSFGDKVEVLEPVSLL